MPALTHTVSLEGETLRRGFWLYVWEVVTPSGEILLYVGRTGDSSSDNAASPFNRMGQHLGNVETSSMLRNHLAARGVQPEACRFRMVAHGPILEEARDHRTHVERRDVVAAMERQLAGDLADAGYDVMNTVRSKRELDGAAYSPVRAAFAKEFEGLTDAAT